MTPSTPTAHMPGNLTSLQAAFTALLKYNNQAFTIHVPKSILDGDVVQIANWALAIDQHNQPDRQFGQFGNCNPVVRCRGCEITCPAEALARDLSNQCGGLSVLYVEASNLGGALSQVTVRTLVPNRPDLSELWEPIINPVTGMLELVALNRSRSALILAAGRLSISDIGLAAYGLRMAANMFAQTWRWKAAAEASVDTLAASAGATAVESAI